MLIFSLSDPYHIWNLQACILEISKAFAKIPSRQKTFTALGNASRPSCVPIRTSLADFHVREQVFSVIMVVSFLQILQESVQRLMSKDHSIPKLPPFAIGSMAGTIGLKGLIWFGCAWQQSSQVQALAQDCKTDVIFNTASLLFPAIGYFAKVWWLE
jgi:hypothetical protein